MLFDLSQPLITYYQTHGHLLIEEAITVQQAEKLGSIAKELLHTKHVENRLQEGHFLSAANSTHSPLIRSKGLAQCAMSLSHHKSLALVFDLILCSANHEEHAPQWLKLLTSAEKLNYFTPSSIGCLVHIGPKQGSIELCQEPRSALFFAPDIDIDFSQAFFAPDQAYLLLIYSPRNAVFHKNDNPLHQLLKRKGYAYGDSIDSSQHGVFFSE